MCWTSKTYNAKLDKLAELKRDRDALDKAVKELEEAIKADLGDLEKLDTGKYAISFPHVEKRSFDGKSFEAKHPKLWAEFQKVTAYRRFSFKAV